MTSTPTKLFRREKDIRARRLHRRLALICIAEGLIYGLSFGHVTTDLRRWFISRQYD